MNRLLSIVWAGLSGKKFTGPKNGYLKTDADLLRDEQREQMISHFKSRISWAKRESEEHKETLRHWINQLLDYRRWFRFTLEYEKGEQPRRELTDARFNVLSGGEKAMAM